MAGRRENGGRRPLPEFDWDEDNELKLLERHGVEPLQLQFEPGKSLVLNAGIGLAQVISKKRLGQKSRMVVLNGSSYNFIPDALVQSDVKYDVLPASSMTRPWAASNMRDRLLRSPAEATRRIS